MIYILVGTRPEIIKMSPVIRELISLGKKFKLIHSNQHYSKDLDTVFFEELQLPYPDFNLQVGSGTHAEQTAKMMIEFERVCQAEKPDLIIVHGDTNTALAGMLVAKKLQIKLAHVESGLRSFDERMPEEINRCLIDRVSNFLFAPTQEACDQLISEGISKDNIFITGNTIVDAIKQNEALIENREEDTSPYILVTAHRPSNVDTDKSLQKLIIAVDHISKKTDTNVIWVTHPRCERRVLKMTNKYTNIKCIKPVGYLKMLGLIKYASYIATDSGGIQEEAYILKKPLITLRETTERPETLTANFICESNLKKIDNALRKYNKKNVYWNDCFGPGDSAKKIVRILKKFI